MFTFLAILLAILGIYVLNRGIRGRRIDGHPHCAKCNFDLHGLTDAPVCPECGASIRGWSSRTIGTFRPRPGLIVTGSLIIVFSLLTISVLSLDLFGRIDWYANMPLWMIEREASSQPPSPSTARARQELLRRAQSGQVPPERLGAFVATLLKPARTDEQLQGELLAFLAIPTLPTGALDAARKWALEQHADRTLPLSPQLSLYLDQEIGSGRVSPKEIETFLRSAVRPELVMVGPQRCAPGDKLPLIFYWNARGSTPLVSSIDLPGVLIQERLPDRTFSSLSMPFVASRRADLVASNVPGPHEISGTATLELPSRFFTNYAAQSNLPSGYASGPENLPPITIIFPVSLTYIVDPTLPNSPADQAGRQIMRSILIKWERGPAGAMTWLRGLISVGVDCPPFTAEIDIEWSDGTTYFPLGKSVISSGANSSTLSFQSASSLMSSASSDSRTPIEVFMAPSDVPSNVRAFRAHVRKVFLHTPGSPPSPVESFDLDFPIASPK